MLLRKRREPLLFADEPNRSLRLRLNGQQVRLGRGWTHENSERLHSAPAATSRTLHIASNKILPWLTPLFLTPVLQLRAGPRWRGATLNSLHGGPRLAISFVTISLLANITSRAAIQSGKLSVWPRKRSTTFWVSRSYNSMALGYSLSILIYNALVNPVLLR